MFKKLITSTIVAFIAMWVIFLGAARLGGCGWTIGFILGAVVLIRIFKA